MAWTVPWQIIAMNLAGDIGDYTIYTDRFQQKVVYPKSPPKDPPSQMQVQQRARFKTAQAAWKMLSNAEKLSLENACRKTSASLTGQNLWISCSIRRDNSTLLTIERQSGVPLPKPTW